MREQRAWSTKHANGHHYRSVLSLKLQYSQSLLHCTSLPLVPVSSPNRLFPALQSKMTTTRSSVDIAMDLTEICAPRIAKLSSIESKDQLIMASNGSLISAGKQRVNQLMASVHIRLWVMIYCYNLELIGHVPIPGSADSEVSEEQRKEKVAELKKKEKELQDTLTQKLEELKKICMREAVSVSFIILFSSEV